MSSFETVIVIAEEKGGEIRKGSLQTIGKAAQLAAGKVHCVVVGSEESGAKQAFGAGASNVQFLKVSAEDEANSELVSNLLETALSGKRNLLILASASDLMIDVAPRLATRLCTAYLGDVTGLDGGLSGMKFRRPVYAGKASELLEITGDSAFVTLRANSFPTPELSSADGSVEVISPSPARQAKMQVVRLEEKENTGGAPDLTEADYIVSGGIGVGGPEGYEPLKKLCAVLNAALGASRAAVHAEWIGPEHQVGQTGKTVSPQLYLACGISGAIQHQAGMRSSKCIVAINTDPNAPIFKLAHYGIAADLHKVVPVLEAELKQALRR